MTQICLHDGRLRVGPERLRWDCGEGWESSAWRRSPCSPARCVLDRPFLRLCRPQRPLEAGRGAGHRERPPTAQGWLPLFCSFLRVPQRFPIGSEMAIKFPHFKVNCCPVTFSFCDTIYTLCIPAAPSRQMASWRHWVLGSLLPFTPPALDCFLRTRTPR